MKNIVDLFITAILLMGTGYAAKEVLFSIEKAAIKKIHKGLSSSESFANKLTGDKLNF